MSATALRFTIKYVRASTIAPAADSAAVVTAADIPAAAVTIMAAACACIWPDPI